MGRQRHYLIMAYLTELKSCVLEADTAEERNECYEEHRPHEWGVWTKVVR